MKIVQTINLLGVFVFVSFNSIQGIHKIIDKTEMKIIKTYYQGKLI